MTLRPMRGIFYGVLFSLPFWALATVLLVVAL